MTHKSSEHYNEKLEMLKNLSTQDFRNFGLHQIAYVRPIRNEEDKTKTLYSIHGADGRHLSVTENIAEAIIMTREYDLEPVIVH